MINSIHSDLIRGHIDTIILSVLHDGDRYGYDILGEIEKKSGGEYILKQPTLYSCLKRLETQGFIYKYWGTETNGGRRTYYSLTEMGKELFQKNKDEWVYSREVINKLISTGGENVVFVPRGESEKDPVLDAEVTEVDDGKTEAEAESDEAETKENAAKEEPANDVLVAEAEQVDEAAETENADEPAHISDAYADVIAEAEIEALGQYNNYEETAATYSDESVNGYCYADRNTEESMPKKDVEPFGTSLFAKDYSEDLDDEDELEELGNEEADETFDGDEDEENEVDEDSPAASFYNDEDFDREQTGYYYENNRLIASEAEGYTEAPHEESIFRHYNDADLSEDTDREITIGREYRKVISELLSGDTEEEYFEALRKAGEEYYAETQAEQADNHPTFDYSTQYGKYEQQANAATAEKTATYVSGANRKNGQANFDELTAAVRSMGDDVRIRTHSADAQKEYNSIYHYYSNKLGLFKYGILFAIMLLEIIIPYTIIKFGAKLYIAGELPVLIISVIGAALLPIYSVIAFLVDPYKRKRFNYNMKSSLLYRTGIMLLLLILTYAANVVFMMDIAFEVDYLFSLITPALLSTNVPLASIIFKKLYDSKKFAVKD